MSLYGMMQTGVSGMNGQANRLSALSDNIANSNTTGYKRSSTEFETLVIPKVTSNYASGGVMANTRYSISQQGDLRYTTSSNDLAINGQGFMAVQGDTGQTYLTRAGSFTPDDQGRLVNTAGLQLMGYSYANGVPSANANGFGGLEPINVKQSELSAAPSTAGTFAVNMPADAEEVAAADLPSANSATASYTAKSSLLTYDSLGRAKMLDIYSTKTADNTWEVSVYDQADASAGTSFPYSSAALATETLQFDGTTGTLATASAKSITVPIPGGKDAVLDLSKSTQFGGGYSVASSSVDGNAPSGIESVSIDGDGTVFAQYANGASKALYRIPLAHVESPDQLTVVSGNLYAPSYLSGAVQIGFPKESGNGELVSGALESSNVDVAEELTNMIEAQRSYTANSKVFQTGADLLDILVNLKR